LGRGAESAGKAQIEPASLGFDLVLGAISKENRFDPLIATCVDKNMHSKNAA
jgi:hypothetical protein